MDPASMSGNNFFNICKDLPPHSIPVLTTISVVKIVDSFTYLGVVQQVFGTQNIRHDVDDAFIWDVV